MASGTQQPAHEPTFSALMQATIPFPARGTEVTLHLYRERSQGTYSYYALANGVRIRPLEHENGYQEDNARAWFEGVMELYFFASRREVGPHD